MVEHDVSAASQYYKTAEGPWRQALHGPSICDAMSSH